MNMRMTRRGAGILIALMLIAVPAAAAVMTQSFVTTPQPSTTLVSIWTRVRTLPSQIS